MNTRRPTGQPNQRRPQRPQARSAGSDGLRRWFPVAITGAILAAAVLIHFGNLRPLVEAAARSLRAQGLFVFTLFPGEAGHDYAVAASGPLALQLTVEVPLRVPFEAQIGRAHV